MDWSLSSYDNLKIKISTENAQQCVALQEGFIGIALQARHPNENLENNLQLESFSVSSVCSVDYSVATLEILEEICIKEWPGPEIIQ